MDRVLGWIRIMGRRGWQLGGVAVGVLVLWTVFQKLQLAVVTIFVALLVVALLTPLTDWLERHGIPRAVAAATSVVGSVLVVIAIATLLGWRLSSQLSGLVDQFQQVRDNVTSWLAQGPLHLSEDQIDDAISAIQQRVQNSWSMVANSMLRLLAIVGALVTALIVAFFVIRDMASIRDWTLDRLVTEDQQELVAAAARRGFDTLQGYIRATVIIGALDGLLIGVGLFALGVPLAAPLAMLTFFGAFFPVVGATVAGLLAVLVAAASGGLLQGVLVLVLVVVVQQVDGNILQPVIMGHAVRLHAIVVLLSLLAGGLLAGIVGALMAVPVVAVLAAMGNEVRRRRGHEAVLVQKADRTAEGDA